MKERKVLSRIGIDEVLTVDDKGSQMQILTSELTQKQREKIFVALGIQAYLGAMEGAGLVAQDVRRWEGELNISIYSQGAPRQYIVDIVQSLFKGLMDIRISRAEVFAFGALRNHGVGRHMIDVPRIDYERAISIVKGNSKLTELVTANKGYFFWKETTG